MTARLQRTVMCALLLAAAAVLSAADVDVAAALVNVRDVTTNDLAGAEAQLDGAAVRFQGEAIGEALRADEGRVWVNVLDDGTAIGVWVERDIAEQIERFGRWEQRGAQVEVLGTFNIACDQHGGDLDVHAERFDILDQGEPIDRPIAWWKGLVGLTGLAIAGALGALYRYRRQKELRLG